MYLETGQLGAFIYLLTYLYFFGIISVQLLDLDVFIFFK